VLLSTDSNKVDALAKDNRDGIRTQQGEMGGGRPMRFALVGRCVCGGPRAENGFCECPREAVREGVRAHWFDSRTSLLCRQRKK
jgi:hypothetical protein